MIGEVPEGLIQRAYYHLGIKWKYWYEKVLTAPTQTKNIATVTLAALKVLTQPTQTKTIATVTLEALKTLTQPTQTKTIV